MGFQLGPGARTGTSTGVNKSLKVILGIAACVLAGWLITKAVIGVRNSAAAVNDDLDARPVITSLQQLGQLHTIKMNMKDVLRKSSDKDAEGWLHYVPGADTISNWATHNEALVNAEGSVEAGIDLSRISAADVTTVKTPGGASILRVHLPRAVVYPPNVRLNVEYSNNGLLWKDENLIPKAEAEASRRFKETAEKGGIRQHAQDNAVERLRQMQSVMGHQNLEFYY